MPGPTFLQFQESRPTQAGVVGHPYTPRLDDSHPCRSSSRGLLTVIVDPVRRDVKRSDPGSSNPCHRVNARKRIRPLSPPKSWLAHSSAV